MNRFSITHIEAGEILDSRGYPTVLATVELAGGLRAEAAVPSGASTGTHEARELRDGNPDRYAGKGVLKACGYVNTSIAAALRGFDVREQESIDRHLLLLDGTPQKSRMGANALLSVSLACAHAAARARREELYAYLMRTFDLSVPDTMPIPLMNIVNGGRHASGNLSIQEFHVIPRLDGNDMRRSIQAGSEIYHALKHILEKAGHDTDLGDEGGYGLSVKKIDDVFGYVMEGITAAGYRAGDDIQLGIDAAASEFYDKKNNTYRMGPPEQKMSSAELGDAYRTWLRTYPITYIEDPFHEEAWDDWAGFTQSAPEGVLVVGDDLFVTNKERVKQGLRAHAANAVLIKPNQIGTLSETMATIRFAHRNNLKTIVSHRSGETGDTTIADLAVASGAVLLKAGAPAQGERVAKYNRLSEIMEDFI